MNIPNKLTVFRAAMVPIFIAIFLIEELPARLLISAVVFSALCLTDYIDGKIARTKGIVTNFGKFLDPLADKVLVVSALVIMTTLKTYSKPVFIFWLIGIIIILIREFMVSALRLICVEQGNVIAANIWGKVKTVSQFLSIIVILLTEQILAWWPEVPSEIRIVGDAMYAICVVATIVSGLIYLKQNASGIGEM